MAAGMNYYITGISGVGKSAVGQELKEKGFLVYDLDSIPDLCSWKNKESGERAKYFTGVGKEWLEAHDWLCDTKKLKEILDQHIDKTVFVVGIASNQREFLNQFSKVFLLHCSERTLLNRINNRNDGNNFAKDPSEQEHVLSWAKEFQEETLKLGALQINTENPIEKVTEEVLQYLG